MSDAFWTSLASIVTTIVAVWLHSRRAAKDIAENTAVTKRVEITTAENVETTKRVEIAAESAKADAAETKAAVTNGILSAVEEVHQATNGMRDELVRHTAELEYAKGLLAGRAQVLEEQEQRKKLRAENIEPK